MKELMEKYAMSISDMMLMASLDGLKYVELNCLEYVEERIQVFLEAKGVEFKETNQLQSNG